MLPGLLAPQLLFDAVIYCLGKVVLRSKDRVTLIQNILLDKPQTALSGLLWRHVPVFVDSPFG